MTKGGFPTVFNETLLFKWNGVGEVRWSNLPEICTDAFYSIAIGVSASLARLLPRKAVWCGVDCRESS